MPTPLPQTCAHNRTCGHFPSPPEIKAPTLDHSANPEKAAARGGIRYADPKGPGISALRPGAAAPRACATPRAGFRDRMGIRYTVLRAGGSLIGYASRV